MKVMVFVKASADSEEGKMPGTELIEAMTKYNEELVNAGVLIEGEGLTPTSYATRIKISGSSHAVIDGPFADTKEIVAGFWLWKVNSMEEAVEWAKKCPEPMEGGGELELRPLFEPDDFGEEFTPELREREDRIRDKIKQKHSGAQA